MKRFFELLLISLTVTLIYGFIRKGTRDLTDEPNKADVCHPPRFKATVYIESVYNKVAAFDAGVYDPSQSMNDRQLSTGILNFTLYVDYTKKMQAIVKPHKYMRVMAKFYKFDWGQRDFWKGNRRYVYNMAKDISYYQTTKRVNCFARKNKQPPFRFHRFKRCLSDDAEFVESVIYDYYDPEKKDEKRFKWKVTVPGLPGYWFEEWGQYTDSKSDGYMEGYYYLIERHQRNMFNKYYDEKNWRYKEVSFKHHDARTKFDDNIFDVPDHCPIFKKKCTRSSRQC